MLTRVKIVPKTKRSEWKGLDRIGEIVHSMGCIWREQEKDDIGIDGEIELCRPRPDGEDGFIGTGKILKVQSKSGSRYVVKDTSKSFASPVEEKDLYYWRDLNVPALYVVYHPDDDCLYWKYIQAYLDENSNAFAKPHRIEFNKAADRLDENAYSELAELCELAPERVLTDQGETLYTNLLPVLRMPEVIYVAPVLPEKQPNFHDRISGGAWIPPYFYAKGLVFTLSDPSIADTALTDVIDKGGVETFGLDDWLSQNENNVNRLKALLNSTLHRHIRRRGLSYSKDYRRYFYNKGLAEDVPIYRTWKSSRTGRISKRQVAKFYEYGRSRFYRHLAFNSWFENFGGEWAVVIEPRVHFTVDGETRWEGKTATRYAIKARVEEYNNVFLNNVLFWAHQLSNGETAFDLTINDVSICQLSGIPATTETTFRYETAAPPDRKVKEATKS